MNAPTNRHDGHRHKGGERYRVELEALAHDGAPAHIRLRAALKCLLRAFRLRCRSVADVTPRQLPGADAPDPDPPGRTDRP